MIPGIRQEHGVVVAGVASEARGAAGPVAGDVIYGVNGEAVRTLEDLRGVIGRFAPDSSAVLQVGRQGQLRFLTVTLE